jgi:2-dehydro-3-deoxyphosphogluconate aldolase/(4S)-4-hydroxy-2-oxoglutarate aldolase
MNPVVDLILATRLIGIIRMKRYEHPVAVANALAAGGLRALEFTMSGEGALEAVQAVREAQVPGVFVGAGTVLTAANVADAKAAGAEFIVTPGLSLAVIEACQRHALPIACGAFTPSEILTAMQAGADLVKLFPARLGGPQYVRDVLAPLSGARLVPTGGVSAENALSYLEAGAVAVAIGGSLVTSQAVTQQNFSEITERALQCVQAVAGYAGARH